MAAAETKTAVIIDNDETWRLLHYDILNDMGFSITKFSSKPEALAHIEHNPPALVVTNYDTDEQDGRDPLNGLELLKRLRGKGIGLVMVTANEEMDEAQVKEAGGASAQYIDKFDAFPIPLFVSRYEAAVRKAMEDAMLIKLNLKPKEGSLGL